MRILATVVAALLIPVAAAAAPITVYNTGVNLSNVLVAAGLPTAHWQLLSAPSGSALAIGSTPYAFTHPAYVANTPTSQWVSPAPNGNAPVGSFWSPGLYVYALTINLAGFNHNTAVITGRFSTDNIGYIAVNGGLPAAISGYTGFSSFTNFTLNSGFVAGLNTIRVGFLNQGNPSAFHVQFSSATATSTAPPPPVSVPELSSLAILGLGLIGARAWRSRRSRT